MSMGFCWWHLWDIKKNLCYCVQVAEYNRLKTKAGKKAASLNQQLERVSIYLANDTHKPTTTFHTSLTHCQIVQPFAESRKYRTYGVFLFLKVCGEDLSFVMCVLCGAGEAGAANWWGGSTELWDEETGTDKQKTAAQRAEVGGEEGMCVHTHIMHHL